MTKYYLLPVFLCSLLTLTAQTDTTSLYLPSVTVTGVGQTVCLPLTVEVFDNLVTFQLSIGWDTDQLAFTEVQLGNNPLSLRDGSSYFVQGDSLLNILWQPSDITPTSLETGTEIITLCLETLMDNVEAIVGYTDVLIPQFVDTTYTERPFKLTEGVINVLMSSSVAEPTWAAQVQLAPNPVATDHLQLTVGQARISRIEVFNLQGQLVRQRAFQPLLLVGDLPNGSYLLRLTDTSGQTLTRRFVKQQ